MTKMEISSQMTYHSVTKVSGITGKSSQIATFLVVASRPAPAAGASVVVARPGAVRRLLQDVRETSDGEWRRREERRR
jgi:hypothetical protein